MTHVPKARYRETHPELFDADEYEAFRAEWQGMPEYTHELATPYRSLTFHFRSQADLLEFARRVGMRLEKGRSFWFPLTASGDVAPVKRRYVDTEPEGASNDR